MSDEEIVKSQVVKDTEAFNEWFDKNISTLAERAKETGLDTKLREVMRMAWRKCSDHKNIEAQKYLEAIISLKLEIASQKKQNEDLMLDLQKVTNKLIQAEKNARK